jgi:hypothetical protein
MKNHLIISGIVFILLIVGFNGCINSSYDSSNIFKIEVIYENNWDYIVDKTLEIKIDNKLKNYQSGSLNINSSENDTFTGYGTNFQIIISIYNNSDVLEALNEDGLFDKKYALWIYQRNVTIKPDKKDFIFTVLINSQDEIYIV